MTYFRMTGSTKSAMPFVRTLLLFGMLLPAHLSFSQLIQTETQELVFAQLAAGGGWESELTLVAQGAERSAGNIRFLTDQGSGMVVSVNGGPEVTSQEYNLPPHSSKTFRLTSTGPTRSGWVIVSSQMPGNVNHGAINGVLTYRYRVGGQVSSQVGILPSQAVTRAFVPFDETNNNLTAIAVATLNGMNLQIQRYGENGAYLEERTPNFGQFTQQALYVHELFPASMNTRGFLLLKGTAPFNVAALNVNQDKWSGMASLPGVFERALTDSAGTVSEYRVRLVQNGNFLYGIAEMTSPQQGVTYPISGAITNSGTGTPILQLNLHTLLPSGEGANVTLIAALDDRTLGSDVSGRAVSVKDDGNVIGSGTFELEIPSGTLF